MKLELNDSYMLILAENAAERAYLNQIGVTDGSAKIAKVIRGVADGPKAGPYVAIGRPVAGKDGVLSIQ